MGKKHIDGPECEMTEAHMCVCTRETVNRRFALPIADDDERSVGQTDFKAKRRRRNGDRTRHGRRRLSLSVYLSLPVACATDARGFACRGTNGRRRMTAAPVDRRRKNAGKVAVRSPAARRRPSSVADDRRNEKPDPGLARVALSLIRVVCLLCRRPVTVVSHPWTYRVFRTRSPRCVVRNSNGTVGCWSPVVLTWSPERFGTHGRERVRDKRVLSSPPNRCARPKFRATTI